MTKNETILKDVAEFAEGLFEGAFDAYAHDIEKCLKDLNITEEYIAMGVEELKKGNFSVEAIVKALAYFGEALEQLPDDVKDCEGLPEETEDLIKWLEKLGNTEEMTLKVLEAFFRHHKECTADVKAAITDFEAHEFRSCGKDVGELFALVFE